MTIQAQAVVASPQQPDRTAGTVVATVGCAALGLAVAGPLGAVVGGSVGALLSSSRSSSTRRRSAALGVSNIRVPREGICEHSSVTYFAVEVVHSNGSAWRVMRRYSDFYKLRKKLRVRYPFPRKHWFGCSGLQLEARRQGLEAWLAYVVLRYATAGVPNWAEAPIRDFLERDASQTAPSQTEQQPMESDTIPVMVPAGVVAGQPLTVTSPDGARFVVTVPQGAGPGSVLHVQKPSSSSALSEATTADTSSQPKILLNICVPQGVQPGQLLAVKVPDGRELTVEVPHGAAEELQLEFDPEAGRLVALPPSQEEDLKATGGHSVEGAEEFFVPFPMDGRPGQLIHVQVPDGRKLPITLPAGKTPGEQFLVKLDPSGRLVLSQW